jgi:hypothetical protein
MSGVKSKLAASYEKSCMHVMSGESSVAEGQSTVPDGGKIFMAVKLTGTGCEGACTLPGDEFWSGKVAGSDVSRSIPRFWSFCFMRWRGCLITVWFISLVFYVLR